MSPEDVKPEWVEKAAREITDYLHGNSAWIPPQHWQIARNVLAAVLPEAMAEAWDEERDQYKAGAQELGAYLIDVTAKIALLREMVHAWDTRSADSGKSPYAVLADIREVLA